MILNGDNVKFKVNIVSSAEEDLFEIYQYVFFKDSEEKTERLYSKLYEKCLSLQEDTNRSHAHQELSLLSIDDFHELTYKSYRIIYQNHRESSFYPLCFRWSQRHAKTITRKINARINRLITNGSILT